MSFSVRLLLLVLLVPGTGLRVLAQVQTPDLLCHWQDSTLTPTSWLHSRYNEVWGVALGGREYAIIGSTEGIHFVDVTEAPECSVLTDAWVAGAAQGSNLIHRDFKHYQHYLYAVADEGASTLQVIDMSGLPNSTTVVYDDDEYVRTAHNLFIDTLTAKLYLCGGNSPTGGFAVRILSLADPEDPAMITSYPNSNFYLPYVHDLYVRNDTAWLNCGNSGLYVVDFTDPLEPVLLGTMTDYPGAGYNHSGWLSDDGHYYFLCDETHGSPVKVVDVSDFTDMHVVATMAAGTADSRIAHNALLRDEVLYVSYYYDGFQAWDVSDPLHPLHIAAYDTYPGADGFSYKGAWGVFPLPSGKNLLSDMQSGLYVFGPVTKPDYAILGPDANWTACAGQSTELALSLGAAWQWASLDVSLEGLSANAVLADSLAGTLTLQLAPAAAGQWAVTVTLWDGVHQSSWTGTLTVVPEPEAPQPVAPPSAVVTTAMPTFEWVAGSADSFTLIIFADTANLAGSVLFSQTVAGATQLSPDLSGILEEGVPVWWLVRAYTPCGPADSEVRPLVLDTQTGLSDPHPSPRLRLFPNPAHDQLVVRCETASLIAVALHTVDGRPMIVHQSRPAREVRLDVSRLPEGVYFLKATDVRGRTALRRVIIAHGP